MDIDEVAIGVGEIIPIDSINKIQHVDGGTIEALLVKEGDMVKKGQVVMILDGKVLKSELSQANTQLITYKKKKKSWRG